jgi:hypothetical protein
MSILDDIYKWELTFFPTKRIFLHPDDLDVLIDKNPDIVRDAERPAIARFQNITFMASEFCTKGQAFEWKPTSEQQRYVP